jgi:hypothetical protein
MFINRTSNYDSHFIRSELPVLWCSIAMKIRMNEMTPEGKILNCGVVIIGKTAREIV